ncbi:MAG TPA: hypothetical protein VFD39_05925, partial [Trueperaceae bacterium]|nr:hypothetical protein [Trueperaceae bacterium]
MSAERSDPLITGLHHRRRPNSDTATGRATAGKATTGKATTGRVGFVSLGCPKALVDSERIV